MQYLPDFKAAYKGVTNIDPEKMVQFERLCKKLLKQKFTSKKQESLFQNLLQETRPHVDVRVMYEYLLKYFKRDSHLSRLEGCIQDEKIYIPFIQYLAILYCAELDLIIDQSRKGKAMKIIQYQIMHERNQKMAQRLRDNNREVHVTPKGERHGMMTLYSHPSDIYHNYPHGEAEKLAGTYISGGDFHFSPTRLDAENVNKVCRILGTDAMYGRVHMRGGIPIMKEWHLSHIDRELMPRIRRRQLLAPIGVVIGGDK